MSKWKESNKLYNSPYLFSKISFIYYVCGCFAQVYVCVISCTQCLTRPEEDIKFLGIGVIDDYELAHGCWELNPGPLEAEPSLQPLSSICISSKLFDW